MTIQAVFVLTCDSCSDLFTYNTYQVVRDVLDDEGWASVDGGGKHVCPRCCAMKVALAEIDD